MNQAQRKFLIEKIEANVKIHIEALRSESREQPPSLENYFYGLALTGKLEIRPAEHIQKVMCEKALTHNADRYNDSWLGTDRGSLLDRAMVKIKIVDLFVVPDEYNKLWDEYRQAEELRRAQIRQLQVECDTLVTRIQLASDKTLEKMISEIDDMGDISLMDTKLKAALTFNEQKTLS